MPRGINDLLSISSDIVAVFCFLSHLILQVKRGNAAAAEANRTLEEAEAQEIERRNMESSNTVANQRGVPALSEHRRQDGWTSTPCVCDDQSEGREYDEMARERLPKQRPRPTDILRCDKYTGKNLAFVVEEEKKPIL